MRIEEDAIFPECTEAGDPSWHPLGQFLVKAAKDELGHVLHDQMPE